VIEEENGEFMFNFDSKFEMEVEFPAALVKCCQIRRGKWKRKAAVCKTISRDVEDSLETVRTGLLKRQTQTITVQPFLLAS